MNKTSLFIKAGALLSILSGGLWLAAPAQAQNVMGCTISGGATYITTLSPTMQGCASEATVGNQFTYLSTGRNMSIGGAIGGAAGVNDGVIELLRKLNDTNSKGIEGDRQAVPNQNLADRASQTDLEQRRMIEPYTRSASAEACREGTVGTGLGGGGGSSSGGAGANSQASGDSLNERFEDEILHPRNEANYLGDLAFAGTSRNYCTQADVTNKVPGCTSVGSLPGANTNPTVLLRGAAPRGTPRNYSIDFRPGDQQFDALVDYVRMSRPFPGPMLNDASKASPAGKQYLVYQRRYNSRVLAVTNALTNVAALSSKMPDSHPFVRNVWNSTDAGNLKEEFTEVYGNRPVPDRPSERELLKLMVLRQYTKNVSGEDLVNTPEYYARRNLEVAKLNAYLLMKMTEQQEWNNILLSHLLSNEIDPVTRAELMQKASAASATRATK